MSDALVAASRPADFSATPGLHAPLIAALLQRRREHGEPDALLVVAATEREADALRSSFECLLPDAELLDLPAWETLPHERLSPGVETVGRRLHAIRRMRVWKPGDAPLVIVAPVRAALQPIVAGLADVEPIELRLGQRGLDLNVIVERLVALAYSRVDLVTRRGEFAVRGGILDVFSPIGEHPVRVDFFGDEIDGLRGFSVADQRTLDVPIEKAELVPARELLLTETVQQRARELQHEFPNLAEMLAKVAEGIPVEGMESLAPVLADGLIPSPTYLPAGAAVCVISPERIASRAVSLADTNREFLARRLERGDRGRAGADRPRGRRLPHRHQLRESVPNGTWWTISAFESQPDGAESVRSSTPRRPPRCSRTPRSTSGSRAPRRRSRRASRPTCSSTSRSRLRHGWSPS